MTGHTALADGCGHQDRVRIAVTGESFAQAGQPLAHDPAPTTAEIDSANRTRGFAPVFFGRFVGDFEAGLRGTSRSRSGA